MKYVIAVCFFGIGFVSGFSTKAGIESWIAAQMTVESTHEAIAMTDGLNVQHRTDWRGSKHHINMTLDCPTVTLDDYVRKERCGE